MTATRRRQLLFIVALLVWGAVIFGVQVLGWGEGWERRLSDRLVGAGEPSEQIVIVAIDNQSLNELGLWPWPRSVHADLLGKIREYEPKVVGYDVTLSEASIESEDQILSEALAEMPIVLAAEATLTSSTSVVKYEEVILPHELFMSAVAGYGITTLFADADGFVRRAPINSGSTQTVRTLAEEIIAKYDPALVSSTAESILRVPYVGPPGSYQTVSAADVLLGQVDADSLRNKIVLVGATAPDLHDLYFVPTSAGTPMAGVEIQANVIQSYLDGRALRLTSAWQNILILIVLAFGLASLSIALRLRYFGLFVPVIMLAYLLVAVAVSAQDLLLPIIYPLVFIVGAYLIDLVVRYLAEIRHRRWVQTAFSRYLAPQVIDRLISGDAPLKLGGGKQELTILFSDIRGFTSLSERLKPEELVMILNEYLNRMTDIVLKTEGVVDKFIGDAVMAFWNAPLLQPDHAARAARSALEMMAALEKLNQGWQKRNLPELKIGIGINTGDVTVGNFGSEKRFDYTAIGDDVNLASRLEGLTKQYGVSILISESTKKQIEAEYQTRLIDKVAVKGRQAPVRIFELIGHKDNVSVSTRQKIKAHESALELYFAKDWTGAKARFEKNHQAYQDQVSQIFIERCRQYLQDQPAGDWDGTYVATSK